MGDGRFIKGARLAWIIDVDRGYRDAARAEWTTVPLSSATGVEASVLGGPSGLRVDRAVETAGVPEILVTPLPHGRAQVRSTLHLIVQGLGDAVPRRVASTVEVGQGTVVRAGPILFALLTEQQDEALRAGRLTLPVIGGGLESEAVWDSLDGADAELRRERADVSPSRARLVLASALALTLLVGAVAYLFWPRPNPRAVLVAVEVDGHDEATLRADLHGTLERAGLEPTAATTRVAPGQGVAALVAEMESTRAAQATLVRISVEESRREGLVAGNRFYRVTAEGQVHVASTSHTSAVHRVTLAGEAMSRRQALEELGDRCLDVIQHGVLGDLTRNEVFSAYFDGLRREERVTVEQGRRAAEQAARARQQVADTYDASCDRARRELADDEGDRPVRFLSDPCAEEYPIGLSADGEHVVVQVETIRPYFSFGPASHVMGTEVPDRIDLVPVGGGERRTLSTARNLFGLGIVSHDGSVVVAVEAEGRTFGIVLVDLDSGRRRVVHSVGPPERLLFAAPSPDGHYIAFWHREARRDRRRLHVIDAAGGSPRALTWQATNAEWVTLPGPDGGPLRHWLATVVEGGSPGVAFVDPSTAETAWHLDEPEHPPRAIVGSLGGVLLFTLRGSCDIARHHPDTGETERIVMPVCLTRPTLAAEGVVVGTGEVTSERDPAPGDTELVAVDLASGEATVLTANAHDEGYLRSRAGTSHVAVARILESDYEHIPRVVVATLDVMGR